MKRINIISILIITATVALYFISCNENKVKNAKNIESIVVNSDSLFFLDTAKTPSGKYGDAIRYGRELMFHTAKLIGPDGSNGKYLGNKMNCTNCHQDAGTKPYSFNLQTSFQNYPEYRAREGRVLSLAERVNNCIMHPHLGKPLPLDSKEMIAFISYLKWINDSSKVDKKTPGVKNLDIPFPSVAASSKKGGQLYTVNCSRCHGKNGEGVMQDDDVTYIYPPLWGAKSYQPGSSMHRIIKMSQWLVANMPHGIATHKKPLLTSDQAFDIAAFINDDEIHERPVVKEFQYPNYEEKAIDYDRGPFADTFSVSQHKYGPYQPIIDYWKSKGIKPSY
ncbi:MAG: c-type cytochrome [Ginsengibacter sp.]